MKMINGMENANHGSEVIQMIMEEMLEGNHAKAGSIIDEKYPFKPVTAGHRSYTNEQKMEQFIRDGFIDRYFGEKLLNPGVLKVISLQFPQKFPYHSHWKMTECHGAYWELVPTIDHIWSVARGGKDDPENWATTSMLHNSIKSNWTLEQVGWKIHPAGRMEDWDGLTGLFLEVVKCRPEFLKDAYVKEWHQVSRKCLNLQ